MPKHIPAIACAFLLTVQTGTSLAGTYREGIVVDVTLDAIKIEQGGSTYTFLLSNDLQTNTKETGLNSIFYARPKEVKKGDKVAVDLDCDGLCTGIRPLAPNDAGIVTEVGKNTITIRNTSDITTTYKVMRKLVEDDIPPKLYSPVYPSRFSEVKVGCRIEVTCYEKDGKMVICGLDVKKDKAKDK